MKKAYQKPRMEAYSMETELLQAMSLQGGKATDSAVLSKGRGDYEEDDFVESIWK